MTEPCEYCGRFMKQVWYLASDEPNDWQDYWDCGQMDKHKADHPNDWAHQ